VCAVVDVQYALSVRWQVFQWASGGPWRDRPNALGRAQHRNIGRTATRPVSNDSAGSYIETAVY
jgi:hypothetical protein